MIAQCNYHFKNGTQCDQSAINESIYCFLHDPDAWRTQTHASEIVEKIGEKIRIGDYNFEGYHFPETGLFIRHVFRHHNSSFHEVNFQNAHFHAPISFSKADFRGLPRGLFCGAEFYENADFTESDFGNADFSEVKFSDVFFKQARFHGSADFRNANFKSADFSEAKFLYQRAPPNRVTATTLETQFFHSNFSGHADFSHVTFRNVSFESVTFKEASFFDAVFEGIAFFSNSSFEIGMFMYARFNSDAVFDSSQLSEVVFDGAHFFSKVDFQNANISQARFRYTIFNDIVLFDHTHKDIGEEIKQRSYWQGDFSSSIFKGTTTFKGAYLDPCFESTIMPSSNLRDTNWPPENVGCFGKDKKKINIESKADEMENGLQKMRQYSKAIRTYFFLRTRLNAEGDFIDESDFFYRERLSQKKLFYTRSCLQFRKLTDEQKKEVKRLSGGLGWEYILELIWLWIAGWTCGFGERILRVVRTFSLTLCFFAVIFFIDMGPCPRTILKCLHDALYVSVGALSNMGVDVNDLAHPLSMCGKWFVQIEALTGIILTSLFLVVFVRKMSRQ